MSHRKHKTIIMPLTVFLCFFMLFVSYAADSSSSKKESPARIDNQVNEGELTTITLTPRAEERLGIKTVPALYQDMQGFMELGGEIIATPGSEIKVSAPFTGTIMANSKGRSVYAGVNVKRGEEIMRLLLIPPAQDLMHLQEEVNVKQVEYDIALTRMERAEQMLKDGATSKKAFQEAQALLATAQASLKIARAKLDLLNAEGTNSAAADLSMLVLKAPVDGIIYQLYVTPGQIVTASTTLFEVVSQSPVWVRIPVYSGSLSGIDLYKTAVVQSLGVKDQTMLEEGSPVKGPPLSNAVSASSNLYYQLPNKDRLFRVGERVRVKLSLQSQEKTLIVPWSSIAYDIYGGTWVYVKTSPYVFSRRRVEIHRIIDDVALINRGIRENDQVVTTAVAELYGTEFGGGK